MKPTSFPRKRESSFVFSSVASIIMAGVFATVSSTVIAQSQSSRPHYDSTTVRRVRTPLVDSQGVRLLEAAKARLTRANTFRARVVTTYQIGEKAQPPRMVTVQFMRPAFARVDERKEVRTSELNVVTIFTDDGTRAWNNIDTTIAYWRNRKFDVDGPVAPFFDSGKLTPRIGEWNSSWLTHPLFESVHFIGRETWRGDEYDVVEWTYSRAAEFPEREDVYSSRAYIGLADTLIHRVLTVQTSSDRPARRHDVEIADIELNAPMTIALFTPPANKTLREVIGQYGPPASSYLGKPLMALSSPARMLDGSTIRSVFDLLRGKKAAVVWAWNVDCSSCVEKFPWIERLRAEYEPRGVSMVAVYGPYSAERVTQARRYMTYHRASMPVVFGAEAWEKPIYDSIFFAVVDASGIVRFAGAYDPLEVTRVLDQLVGVPGS